MDVQIDLDAGKPNHPEAAAEAEAASSFERLSPNYFVAIQINSATIVEELAKYQAEVVRDFPALRKRITSIGRRCRRNHSCGNKFT